MPHSHALLLVVTAVQYHKVRSNKTLLITLTYLDINIST